MLFCNVDHIEPRLLPKAREASSRFFRATQPLNELFRQLELGSDREGGSSRQVEASRVAVGAAGQAQEQFREAAESLKDLALDVHVNYDYINDEIRRANGFDAAARYARLSPDSSLVREMISDMLRLGVDSLLTGCADRLLDLSGKLNTLGARIAGVNAFQDRDYDEAHILIADWNALMARGQFISAVCYIAAQISSR